MLSFYHVISCYHCAPSNNLSRLYLFSLSFWVHNNTPFYDCVKRPSSSLCRLRRFKIVFFYITLSFSTNEHHHRLILDVSVSHVHFASPEKLSGHALTLRQKHASMDINERCHHHHHHHHQQQQQQQRDCFSDADARNSSFLVDILHFCLSWANLPAAAIPSRPNVAVLFYTIFFGSSSMSLSIVCPRT